MRLLFVDVDPMILNGLQRMLRPMRKDWDIRFAEGGAAAIKLLEDQSADVVVSDMRMPGMTGPQLLARIAETWPATIRIALSGQADLSASCESTAVTHQYLSKPCELDRIRNAVERARLLKSRLHDPELEALIGGLKHVPSIPQMYVALTEELQSEDCSVNRIGKILGGDIAMTASILKLVNSAYFGLPREVNSPTEAATYVGADILRTLVLTTGIFRSYEEKTEGRMKLGELWQHSNNVAAVAKLCAQKLGMDAKVADMSYMAGMVHDVGVLLLAANEADKYEQAMAIADEQNVPSWEAELEVFGKTHMEVGAYLLGIWNLPQRIVEAAAYHHRPSEFGTPDGVTILTVVHLANAISDEIFGASYRKETVDADETYLQALGIADGMEQLKADIAAEVARR